MSLFVAQTLNKQNEHVPLNMPLIFCKIIRIIVFLVDFQNYLQLKIVLSKKNYQHCLKV